jgi:hypothetical protein
MMDNLTGNNRNSERDRGSQQPKGISMTLGLILSGNGVEAAVNESGDLAIEMMDLLSGPLDFCPTAVEWMGWTGSHDQNFASKAALGISVVKQLPTQPS